MRTQQVISMNRYYCMILCFAFASHASADYICKDYRGQVVATHYTTDIDDGAKARQGQNGPVILANRNILSNFSAAILTFVYAHECAHHTLGHLKQRTSNPVIEQEADCWAAQTLIALGVFDDQDLHTVQVVMQQFGKEDNIHPKPEARAKNLLQCLNQDLLAARN